MAGNKVLAPLLLILLSTLVGCGDKPVASTSTPITVPAPAPVPPSVADGPVIYLAAQPPGLRVPTSIAGVTLSTSGTDLQARVGTTPAAIWIDASAVPSVDAGWLQGLYHQRWPIMVIGPAASTILEQKLGLDPSPETEQTAAMRQKSLSGNDVQARWLLQPDPAELVALHRALLSTVATTP